MNEREKALEALENLNYESFECEDCGNTLYKRNDIKIVCSECGVTYARLLVLGDPVNFYVQLDKL
jgi:ribosomal protein L37AE/L43A